MPGTSFFIESHLNGSGQHGQEHFTPTASFPPLVVDLNTSETSSNLVFVSLGAEGEVNDAIGGLQCFLWGLTLALQPRKDDSFSS